MGITINHKDVSAGLKRLANRAPAAAARALTREGESIMAKSKQDFVPVDQGVLRASGTVTTEASPGDIKTTLAYGGAASKYAVVIHEHPSEYDPPRWKSKLARGGTVNFSPSGRGPKYLQAPFDAAIDGMTERIGDAIGRELGIRS